MLKRNPKQARRGIILMVVLMLLTLFAIVGVSFVLYADSEATSARLDRESRSVSRPDIDPTQALHMILGQIIYGVDDEAGVYSGIRGYDLARGVYGANSFYDNNTQRYYAMGNSAPFTGNGRLHFIHNDKANFPILAGSAPGGNDDWLLVNYTYFPGDAFLRDPDRYGPRLGLRQTGSADNRAGYLAGSGAPYTYPDHNNFYLGVIRGSDGAVLAHSFHRPWMGFGTLAPNNPNWFNPAPPAQPDPLMKYRVLRPRPADNPGFPAPEDAGGDVKNFLGGPGYYDPITQKFCNNDSFWVDIGLPAMVGPDGKPFKMLAAMLIVDLGGRIDLNAHGNIRATNNGHSSNQGWGPWEVNPSRLLSANGTNGQPEYPNLFAGRRNATGVTEVLGKYGFDPANANTPTPVAQNPAIPGYTPHIYGPVDFDSVDTANAPTTAYTLPLTGTNIFPNFPAAGYQNGNITERTNHPLGFNALLGFPAQPWTIASNTKYNLTFPASDMERLLRFEDTDGPSMASQLERLLPINFNDPANPLLSAKRRRLVTTHSSDRMAPGIFPYVYFPTGVTPPFQNYSGNGFVPSGPPIPFPTLNSPTPAPSSSPGGEFAFDWRAAIPRLSVKASGQALVNVAGQPIINSALQRINLNRPLTPYPMSTPIAGTNPPQYNPQTTGTYAVRFDDPAYVGQWPQFLQAQQDRQVLANDIYRTLLAVTGVPPVATPAAPTPQELAPRRWLAQLAVNIVDFIDEDDISTPFNFYNTDDGLDAANIAAPNGAIPATPVAGGSQTTPLYWVFGTELPHLVLNEVLAETPDARTASAVATPQVKLWLELYNPFLAGTATTQPQDGFAVPLFVKASSAAGSSPYAPYRIEISNGAFSTGSPVTPGSSVTFNDNILGAGPNVMASVDYTDFADTNPTRPTLIGNNNPQPAQPGIAGAYVPAPQGFFLIGPSNNPALTAPDWRDPFVAQGAAPTPGTVLPNTPVLRTNNVTYSLPAPGWAANPTTPDERTTGVTVLLRRLANPHLPWNDQRTFTPMTPGATPQINPLYNPYVTVDVITNVPLRDQYQTTPYASRSKRQPYAALTKLTGNNVYSPLPESPMADSAAATKDNFNVQHTFGTFNNPPTNSNANGAFDWLVHLDRQVISPMELLNVSAVYPYQLTQTFVQSDSATPGASVKFQYLAPWFDPGAVGAGGTSNRLYRLLEFLETNNRGAGNPTANRQVGKININAIWDFETFQALCDAQKGNHFTSSNGDFTNPGDVERIYIALMNARSPDPNGGTTYLPGPVGLLQTPTIDNMNPQGPGMPKYYILNKPILPLSTGYSPGANVPPGSPADNQNYNVRSINDTLLQQATTPAAAMNPPMRLFEAPSSPPTTHPYQRYELLTKIFNNVTTRSNTFAVWVTVGFFDYNPATRQLGAEIGRSEGRNVRHRLFAVVDRSNTVAFTTATNAVINPVQPMQQGTQAGSMAYGLQSVALTTAAPVAGDPNQAQVVSNAATGMNWAITTTGAPNTLAQALVQPLVLVYEPGTPNEETVVATPVAVPIPGTNPPQTLFQLQAVFTKSHAQGVAVQCRGNPGPWTRYDPRQDPGVVLHYSIIE
jgi:hypothetical protein